MFELSDEALSVERVIAALVEAITARAPIWKREYGPDGPHWVGWVDARCHDRDDGHGHGHGDHP